MPRLDSPDAGTRRACQAAVHRLLVVDAQGALTQQAAQLLADLVRVKRSRCHPGVVAVLLGLDIAGSPDTGGSGASFGVEIVSHAVRSGGPGAEGHEDAARLGTLVQHFRAVLDSAITWRGGHERLLT